MRSFLTRLLSRAVPLHARQRPSRRGFTFVELVLVVMVLGIMAGVAAPRYQAALADIELATAAKQLAAHLRHVRQQAINRSASLGLEFDTVGGLYRSAVVGGESVSDPDHPGQPLLVRFDPTSSRVQLATVPAGQVVFDLYGDPAAADQVELTNSTSTARVRWNAVGNITVEL